MSSDGHDQRFPRGEHRLGPSLVVVLLVAIPFLLPSRVYPTSFGLGGILAAVLLVGVVAADPGRIDRKSGVVRGMSIALTFILVGVSAGTTVALVVELVDGAPDLQNASDLLTTGALVWIDTSLKFSLDTEAVGTLITEAEDSFAIGDHDDGNFLVRDAAQHLFEAIDIGVRHEQPAIVLVDLAELLARLSDDRRVDDRHQLDDVVEHNPQEQCLVVVLHAAEEHVLSDVGCLHRELGADAVGSLLDRFDMCGHEAVCG